MYYKYSELYKQNSVDKQLKIEYDGGTITNSELYSEGFELTESLCSETNLKFGTCEASVLKFKIANVVESLKGKWLTVTETLAKNENEPLQFGKYKVYSDVPSADRNYRDVTAYDGMYDILNADMTEWYNGMSGSSVSIQYLRTKFLDYFGVEYEDIVLPNDYMIVQISTAESLSGKDFINAICELNGCFGHIGRDGKFYFKFLSLFEEKALYPTKGEGKEKPEYYFDGQYAVDDDGYPMFFINADCYVPARLAKDSVYIKKEDSSLIWSFRNPTCKYNDGDKIALCYNRTMQVKFKDFYQFVFYKYDSSKAQQLDRGGYFYRQVDNNWVTSGYSWLCINAKEVSKVSYIPIFLTYDDMEYFFETGDCSKAINYFKEESKEETDNENSQIDVLYPSDSLYSVSSIVELQSRFFDGNYKIEDGYLYFKVYGKFGTKDISGNEVWYDGNYEARFRFTAGCSRACIRWKSGFYVTHDEETYRSPCFYWLDSIGQKQYDYDIYPEIDLGKDGSFSYQRTIYVLESEFNHISGVPVFETDDALNAYLTNEDLSGCINWNGINDIEGSRCISGKYEDYTVKKIDCVQIKNEEDDMGAVAGDGENIYVIEDNFLCYGKTAADLQTIVDNIYNTIKDVSYLPYEAEVLGNPCLEVADRVRVKARNKTIDSYILKRTIKGIQSIRDTYSATGEEVQSKNVNSVGKSIIQLKKRTNTLKRTVDETISEIYSLDESGEKISKIQQNADAISLKVNKGEVSSEISVESGNVSIKGNRLTVESDNFSLDGSGEVAVTGSIKTSGSSSSVAKLDSGSLGFEIDSDYIGAIATAEEAETLKSGITINTAQKFLSLGFGDNENAQMYYILNNGLNPNGITRRHYFEDSIYSTKYVIAERFYCDDLNGYIYGAGATDAEARLKASGNFSVHGDFVCGGTKNRMVNTENYGNVLMNAVESTGAYFTDIGSGKITDGVCHVYLDDKFMEVIDTTHEYQVFVTNTSKEKTEYVEKHDGYFVVHGEDGATFDWMLTAKQKGYQNIRMETFPDDEEETVDYDESVFYEDDISATQTEEYMSEFADNIDDNAIAYVTSVAEMENEQFLI